MSSLTAYFGQVSATVEFLDAYGPIVFHCKKIHCKILMTIFFQFFLDILFHQKTFTHTLFNCKKIHCKTLMTFPCHFIPLQTFPQTLFNCKKIPLQNIYNYLFSIFLQSFYSFTKHLHIYYLIVNLFPLHNISTNII